MYVYVRKLKPHCMGPNLNSIVSYLANSTLGHLLKVHNSIFVHIFEFPSL